MWKALASSGISLKDPLVMGVYMCLLWAPVFKHIPWHTYGGQMPTCRSHFYLPFGSWGLNSDCMTSEQGPYLLSGITGPHGAWFLFQCLLLSYVYPQLMIFWGSVGARVHKARGHHLLHDWQALSHINQDREREEQNNISDEKDDITAGTNEIQKMRGPCINIVHCTELENLRACDPTQLTKLK